MIKINTGSVPYMRAYFSTAVDRFARKNNLYCFYQEWYSSTTFVIMDAHKHCEYYVSFVEIADIHDALEQLLSRIDRDFDISAKKFLNKNKSKISTTPRIPEIKNVIFNAPATIVYWADGSKTVVKCQDEDKYSKEVGLAMCIVKKTLGNKGNYNDIFRTWIPES